MVRWSNAYIMQMGLFFGGECYPGELDVELLIRSCPIQAAEYLFGLQRSHPKPYRDNRAQIIEVMTVAYGVGKTITSREYFYSDSMKTSWPQRHLCRLIGENIYHAAWDSKSSTYQTRVLKEGASKIYDQRGYPRYNHWGCSYYLSQKEDTRPP